MAGLKVSKAAGTQAPSISAAWHAGAAVADGIALPRQEGSGTHQASTTAVCPLHLDPAAVMIERHESAGALGGKKAKVLTPGKGLAPPLKTDRHCNRRG